MSRFKSIIGHKCYIGQVEDASFKIVFAKDYETDEVVVLEFLDKRGKSEPDIEHSTAVVRKR